MSTCITKKNERRSFKKINTKFVGVLNVTPDSFSDGGRFFEQGGSEDILEIANNMILDGANILDVGGESTVPLSKEVSLDEELKRVVPTVLNLRKRFPKVLISVDTWKSEVAKEALVAGANIINDVTAGRADPKIFDVVANANVPMILMYSKQASPRTNRDVVQYDDVIKTIKDFLIERVSVAKSAGVKKIIIDPGMGAFVSGDPKYSFTILDRILEFRELGFPILVGTSRKGFLGTTVEEREAMTLWTTILLRGKVDYLRVHDMIENVTATAC